jgi:branched-chain amino acid transport system substrate-binding protein/urea transport system substrate-binding protein
MVEALEGLTLESPLGPVTVDPKTHRVAAPEFYGPVVTVPGESVKRMSPVTLVR